MKLLGPPNALLIVMTDEQRNAIINELCRLAWLGHPVTAIKLFRSLFQTSLVDARHAITLGRNHLTAQFGEYQPYRNQED